MTLRTQWITVLAVLGALTLSLVLGLKANAAVEQHEAVVAEIEYTTISSTVSRGCMEIVPASPSVVTASSNVLLVYEGSPDVVRLVLTSCGVKQYRHHTIYLNGQPVAQVDDDPFNHCPCGDNGQVVTYTLSSSAPVISGWNVISVTNDADVTDPWTAQRAQLIIDGHVTQTLISEHDFKSDYDGAACKLSYQLPIGYDPAGPPVPLLVSVPGSGEDGNDAVYRFAGRANERGWVVLGINLPRFYPSDYRYGRTASPSSQHQAVQAIEYMKANFNVDVDRIYMSGFSSGGGVAATIAAKYPAMFAAVVDWAGPTDLPEWTQQTVNNSLKNHDFGCWPEGIPNPCPFEWRRRSARLMSENLKYVPLAIVHGRADTSVGFDHSEKLYLQMGEYFDLEEHNKLAVWHDGGHVDWLREFEGLDWMAQFSKQPEPRDIMIRADENKDYYWISVQQLDWNGNWNDGWTAILASYDPATRVISATIRDNRLCLGGALPVDVSFDLQQIGFDPGALYTIEDENLSTGDFQLTESVAPVGGKITVHVARDSAADGAQANHRFRIYPYPAPNSSTCFFQQGTQPPGYAGVQDTYLYQYDGPSSPGHGSAGDLIVNPGGSMVSLLRFDLSSIPPQSSIKKAYLHLYLTQNKPSLVVSAYRVLQPWTNQTTWSAEWAAPTAPGGATAYDPQKLTSRSVGTAGRYSFDLKGVVQQWVSGATPNDGVLLAGPWAGGAGSSYYRFASSEAADPSKSPMLEVWYMEAELTPMPTATATATPTATQTPTLTPTATATATQTSTLTPTQTMTQPPLVYDVYLPLIIK